MLNENWYRVLAYLGERRGDASARRLSPRQADTATKLERHELVHHLPSSWKGDDFWELTEKGRGRLRYERKERGYKE